MHPMPCKSETVDRVAKKVDVWDLRTLAAHIWYPFELVVFKVIF